MTDGGRACSPFLYFDRHQALDSLGGMEDLLEETIGLYQEDSREHLALLQAAAESGNVTMVENMAHSIKGASLQVGAGCAGALAHELEQAARLGRTEDLGELTASLVQALGLTWEEMALFQGDPAEVRSRTALVP